MTAAWRNRIRPITIAIKEEAQVRVRTGSIVSAASHSAKVDCTEAKSFSEEHGDEWVYRAMWQFLCDPERMCGHWIIVTYYCMYACQMIFTTISCWRSQ